MVNPPIPLPYARPHVKAVLILLPAPAEPVLPPGVDILECLAPARLPEVTILSPDVRYPDGRESRRLRLRRERMTKKHQR